MGILVLSGPLALHLMSLYAIGILFFFSIHHTRLFFRNNKLTFPPGKSSILISPTLAALMFFGNRKGTYICISLAISKVEHPFVQLLSLDFFFFWKLSILCSHYSIGVLFFRFVRALGTLYRAYQTVHIWIIACWNVYNFGPQAGCWGLSHYRPRSFWKFLMQPHSLIPRCWIHVIHFICVTI